ncbi:MAG: acyltransferase [Xanthomonadales bacterium]|nr:acyltransferase [Xanthomonadales bacterium]
MSKHWRQQREGGGYFALWLIRTIALYGGRRFARLFLYPITGYFFLRRHDERAASRAFLTRVFGKPPSNKQILHHIHWRAATLLDRIFFLTRGVRGFDIDSAGVDMLKAHLAAGKGMLLVGSHFGSFEVMRSLAEDHHVPLRIVLNTQQMPAQSALFAKLAPDLARNIIDGSQDPASTVLAMAEATAQGHVVALLGDRGRPDETMLRVPFLGAPAPFPIGPWMLATALKVPVIVCYGIYRGGNRYQLIFEHFADPISVKREQRAAVLHDLITAYAERLQHYTRRSPYNWFNFYDFWDDAEATETITEHQVESKST